DVADQLPAGGISAVVDLAAPLASFATEYPGLHVRRAGPMITAPMGYPTTSWGRDGYGLECATVEDVQRAVQSLAGAGADVVKLALNQSGGLAPALGQTAVDAAHALGLKVAAHALEASAAALAG